MQTALRITKDEIRDYLENFAARPMTEDELIAQFNIDTVEDIQEFKNMLSLMEADGKVIFTRKQRYGIPEKMNLIVGRMQGNAKGFGFLIPDNPLLKDVFVKSDLLNGAMHNDRVIVRLDKTTLVGKRQEGEVIRILKRANQRIVGTFESSRNFGFVVTDDKRISQDIFISKKDTMDAKDGDKVVVEIIQWPEKRRNPEGAVIEVLGNKRDPGTDILSVIRKYQLPEEFPPEVLKAADGIDTTISEKDLEGRKDLRALPMVTIDGEDAKDLDDAVTLEKLPNGNSYLGVHIADVSYYVREGSILDKEAVNRGTSVYLTDRVIPMLPKRLSNGICSLNAGEDRLAMSCFMEIDHQGEVVDYEICQSVIHVKERMTYTNVNKILKDQDHELIDRYQGYVELFQEMERLAMRIREKRLRRGAIDFDFPEVKVKLDEKGKAIALIPRTRNIAEQIIEEFMIAANETVAENYYWMEVPFLYRVHEEPDADDLQELNDFLSSFGYFIKSSGVEVDPLAFQVVVSKVKGRPEEKAVNTVMLRSMKHARYAPDALGHFGLASQFYSHFTSPIRRYPDLAIHRVIREIIEEGSITAERHKKLSNLMAFYGEQSSLREKIAEDAEREVTDMKKVEYMKQFVGDVFEGIISSVTSFGLFIELENTVEGLVHVSAMADDFYQFNDKLLMLVGEHTRKTYRIGDKVKVQLVRVNVDERVIDFELVNDKEQ